MTNYYGHLVGSCTRVKNDAIVWIPKNASTTLRSADPKRYNYKEFEVRQYYVLLRDPYTRWKSGIYEYWFRNKDKEEEILDTIDKIEFDEHTVPQTTYLDFEGPTRYLNLDVNGLLHLNNEVKLFNNIPVTNNSFNNLDKLHFSKRLDSVLGKKMIDKIDEYYYNDYILVNKEFYEN